ncbi:MAG: TOBE domain-containing protein, partial [Gammaproteobacteria bacterium]|nr:TOBE domain-containing protein [Gammaproteobacteria bacterium]
RLRKDMQTELKSLQHDLGITFVFVTHDQEEALSLSDHIIVLDQGVIKQAGTPREIYEEPANLTVAKFVGEANIFATEVIAADLKTLTVKIEDRQFQLRNERGFTTDDAICTLVRPEDLRVWDRKEITAEEQEKLISGKVIQVNYKGSTVDLIVELASGKKLFATEFFDEEDENLDYHLNEQVWVEWLPGWEIVLADES